MSSIITTTSATDAYGNSYTTAISGNDSLENEDFLTLMLTELSMQDPTEPVDSSSMLDDQLSLQTLETNISLTESMNSLATSFSQSALADSSALIGNIVETSETDSDGNPIQYKVSAVEGSDGTITLTAYEINDYYDVYYFNEIDSDSEIIDSDESSDSLTITTSNKEENSISTYGKTYTELADELNNIDGVTASIVQNTSGNYQLVVSASGGSSSLSQNGLNLSYTKDNATSYSSEAQTLNFTNVTKIY